MWIGAHLSVEISVDYLFLRPKSRGKCLSNQDLRIHRSGTAIGGIAELAAFKLQWNCSDRNIDRARRSGPLGCSLVLQIGVPSGLQTHCTIG